MMEERKEYMVYGYSRGEFFREFFAIRESAVDYAKRFKAWASPEDFCHIAECDVKDVIMWDDI